LEGHSLSIVQVLEGDVAAHGPSVLLENARLMLNGIAVHQITHTYHEGNLCVDCAAEWIPDRGQDALLVSWFFSELFLIGRVDVLGINYERA